jgi:hypothetical protein
MENKIEKTSWISHIECVVMFVTLIGGFYSISSRIDNYNDRMDQLFLAWHQESKDFHGRLCCIEERHKK